MSDIEDLKNMLDKLKGEAGHHVKPPEAAPKPAPAPAPQPQRPRQPEVFRRPGSKAPSPSWGDLAWAENKETLLLGLLACLALALGGMLGGFDYAVMAGSAGMVVFSALSALLFFGYFTSLRGSVERTREQMERLEALSRRLEAADSALSSGRPAGAALSGERGLEAKVEELRTMVKALSKAVGHEKENS